MSGGEKIYARRAAERLLATRRFLPGETMSPAYFGPDGQMVWGTAVALPDSRRTWELRWADTDNALGYVRKVIRERQEQIDKKEYAQDEILRLARARAMAIGQVRIELNMEMERARRSLKFTFYENNSSRDALRYLSMWSKVMQAHAQGQTT